MPTARIIVLDSGTEPTPNVKVVFWLDVPAARQVFYANATKTSAWKNISAGDLADLRAGLFTEIVELFSTNPPIPSNAAIKTALEARLIALQTFITNYNPWVRYGITFNGTVWSGTGVT